jgi:hypothetical protein
MLPQHKLWCDMVEKRYPTRHTTIGSVIDAGLAIRGFCLDCGHDAEIDLAAAARALGRKHSTLPVYLVPKVHCDVCKSKNVGTYLADADATIPEEHQDHVADVWRSELTPPDKENR